MTRTPVKGPLFSESMSSLFLKLGQARTRDVHVYSQYLTVASRFGVPADAPWPAVLDALRQLGYVSVIFRLDRG